MIAALLPAAFVFGIVVTSVPGDAMGVHQAVAVEVTDPPQPLTEIERVVLEFVERAALQGRELESNDEIGDHLKFTSTGGVRAVMLRLERKGVIKVRSFQRGRSVFAVRVGKWTKPPLCTVPHWRSVERSSRDATPTQPVVALIQAPTVMDEVQRLMRERNLTMSQAQIVLMSYGVSLLAAEQALAATAFTGE